MNDTEIRDCPPGTVPAAGLRVACYDGEWLVLLDEHAPRVCTCPEYGQRSIRYGVLSGYWDKCNGCPATVFYFENIYWTGDSLAEAHAAFTRIEAKWRAAKAGQ